MRYEDTLHSSGGGRKNDERYTPGVSLHPIVTKRDDGSTVRRIWKDPERHSYEIVSDHSYGEPGSFGGPSLTGLENYVPYRTQPTIGGEVFNPQGDRSQASKIRELLESQQFHRPWKNPEREYLGTAGALREAIGAAYGINTTGQIGHMKPDEAKEKKEELGLTGDYKALDPLVQMEQELQERFDNYKIRENQDLIEQMFQSRNQSLGDMLQAQSAAMGTPGLYQGTMDAAEASRDTIMNQAKAAYKPIQAMMEKQYEQKNQQLLGTLQQLQQHTEATVRSMGQQGVFERG